MRQEALQALLTEPSSCYLLLHFPLPVTMADLLSESQRLASKEQKLSEWKM